MNQKSKTLFTDGEGPIVHLDLAANVTESRVPELFPLLSLYDDYLAETGTEGYQAGDTLALAVPTLIAHGITDEDIVDEVRKNATLCKGVKEYIAGLKKDNWDVRIISTAYSQLWELVGQHIGVPMEDIACTNLDLKRLREQFGGSEFENAVMDAEADILSLLPLKEAADHAINEGRSVVDVFNDPDFALLRDTLDDFYWKQLPDLGFNPLKETNVMGGRRKVEAGQGFARELGVGLSDVAYVGDSITDDAMHAQLKAEGGLPIAINGNGYALRNARVAVATEDMRNIRPILDAWQRGGFEGVQRRVNESKISFTGGKEGAPRHEQQSGAQYDLIDSANTESFDRVAAVHKESRVRVRGAAAKLG